MGYYTYFNISAEGYPRKLSRTEAISLKDKLVEKLNDRLDYFDVIRPFDNMDQGYYVSASGESKWYDCEIDMENISGEFPDILFTVNGDGEESDDIWCHYWLGGQVQTDGVVIQHNPFDPSKLGKDL